MAAIKKRFRYFVAAIVIFMMGAVYTTGVSAEDYVTTQVYTHQFNEDLSIYSGVFALNKDLSLDTSLYAKYTVDFINPFGGDGGDVSAVSGASAAKDTRNEATVGVTHNFKNAFGIEAYYDYSEEKDYLSKTPMITLKKELFDKNTTFTLAYSRSDDEISGEFVSGTETRDTDNYFVGITQVLSPFTLAQAGYSRSDSSGYMSEGIRLVALNGGSSTACEDESATCVDEAFPDSRLREAYFFGLSHYFKREKGSLLDRSSVKLTYRYYTDDWDITSHTEEAEFYKYLSDRTLLRLNFRHYDQTDADFVKETYSESDEFKTSSPQLEAFNSQLGGVKLTYFFGEGSSVEGKYELYNQSTDVQAHVFMLGVRFLF